MDVVSGYSGFRAPHLTINPDGKCSSADQTPREGNSCPVPAPRLPLPFFSSYSDDHNEYRLPEGGAHFSRMSHIADRIPYHRVRTRVRGFSGRLLGWREKDQASAQKVHWRALDAMNDQLSG